MSDWNDFRYLVALADAGSTAAAARRLGVSQTTVARRIDALERALGVPLCDRTAGGYRLTARGAEAAALARGVARAAEAVEVAAGAWRREVGGVLRVTTTELLATDVLAPMIADLRGRWPALSIELVADDRRLDLGSGEADVAVRVGARGDDPDAVVRRIGDSRWGLFAARPLVARLGLPVTADDLTAWPVVAGGGGMAALPAHRWLEGLAPGAEVVMRCNSVANLAAAVRSGIGLAPLPCLLASADPGLVRCLPELHMSAPIWLTYRASLRDAPQLRAFADALAATVRGLRGRLLGEAQAALPAGPASIPT